MLCTTHNKEMRQNSNGWYCPTPVRKSPDGTQVLEWCQFGKDAPTTPQRDELIGKVLATMNAKLDKVLEGQKLLSDMLSSIGGRTAPEPTKSDKPLPF